MIHEHRINPLNAKDAKIVREAFDKGEAALRDGAAFNVKLVGDEKIDSILLFLDALVKAKAIAAFNEVRPLLKGYFVSPAIVMLWPAVKCERNNIRDFIIDVYWRGKAAFDSDIDMCIKKRKWDIIKRLFESGNSLYLLHINKKSRWESYYDVILAMYQYKAPAKLLKMALSRGLDPGEHTSSVYDKAFERNDAATLKLLLDHTTKSSVCYWALTRFAIADRSKLETILRNYCSRDEFAEHRCLRLVCELVNNEVNRARRILELGCISVVNQQELVVSTYVLDCCLFVHSVHRLALYGNDMSETAIKLHLHLLSHAFDDKRCAVSSLDVDIQYLIYENLRKGHEMQKIEKKN